MNLLELVGEDQQAAKKALKLVKMMSPFFYVMELQGDIKGKAFSLDYQEICESEELMTTMERDSSTELVKGLCFMMCVTTSLFLCKGKSPIPHFQMIRRGMDKTLEAGTMFDLSGQQIALNLLEATGGHGGSFHLQLQTLQANPSLAVDVIVSLVSLFVAMTVTDLNKDIEEVTDYLYAILDY